MILMQIILGKNGRMKIVIIKGGYMRDFLEETYYKFCYLIIWKVRNVFRWLPFLWKKDGDTYVELMQMIAFKMRLLADTLDDTIDEESKKDLNDLAYFLDTLSNDENYFMLQEIIGFKDLNKDRTCIVQDMAGNKRDLLENISRQEVMSQAELIENTRVRALHEKAVAKYIIKICKQYRNWA